MEVDEHLCRGKRADDKEWIFGYFMQEPSGRTLISAYSTLAERWDWAEVDPSTTGRCTGLTDKNGVKIYEGDIVQVPFWRSVQSGLTMKGVVELHRAAFSVLWEHQDYGRDFAGYIRDMEVIGNIHDNPDLLEEES